MHYILAINVLENTSCFIVVFLCYFNTHISVILHPEKEWETAIVEQRQRQNGEVINSILRLSIYCVKF